MTILGRFDKQPVERDVYTISFLEDLSPTDELETGWQMVGAQRDTRWDLNQLGTVYQALTSDDGRQIVTTADVLAPASPSQGFRLRVANASPSNTIVVAGVSVLPRAAVVLVYQGSTWAIEVKSEGVLVNTMGDQRFRTFVSRGNPGVTYKVDVTVTTSEGRVLQNEFLVKIKEN